jgi:hypothetical protein
VFITAVQQCSEITRYHSNRGFSFSFRRVPQIWRSQSGYVSIAFFSRDHLFRLSPANTKTRGRGIPLYRPAGLWHPVDPSHVFVGCCSTFRRPRRAAQHPKDPLRRRPTGLPQRVSARFSLFRRTRAVDGPRIAFPPQESERLALGTRSSDVSAFRFATQHGILSSARSSPRPLWRGGCLLATRQTAFSTRVRTLTAGRATHLHHLQQQLQAVQLQYQALLAQAAQQPWLFGGIGGTPAQQQTTTTDLTSVLADLSTIEMSIMARLDPLEAGLADLQNNVRQPRLPLLRPPWRAEVVFRSSLPLAPLVTMRDPQVLLRARRQSVARPQRTLLPASTLLGVASGDLAHDLLKCGLSPGNPPLRPTMTTLTHFAPRSRSQRLTPRSSRPVLLTRGARIPGPGTPWTRTLNAPTSPRRQTNLSHPLSLRQLTPMHALDLQCRSQFLGPRSNCTRLPSPPDNLGAHQSTHAHPLSFHVAISSMPAS